MSTVESLRRVRDEIPLRVWLVASVSFWERAGFWGLTAPWQNYMQHPRPQTRDDTPGALGMGQVQATRIYCGFYIAYYISPMIFALVADSRVGRFKTLLGCLLLFNFGCAIMTVSSLPSRLDSGWGLPGMVMAMVAVALGSGGVQSVLGAFLADQYTVMKPRIKTLASGEQVLVDRSLTLEYIYSLNYWLGNVGSLSWFATVALEKHASFTWAYGLVFGLAMASLITLAAGRSQLLLSPQERGTFTQARKILLCASRHGFQMRRADPRYQLEHWQKIVPWNEQSVCELGRSLRGCRILLSFVMFYICFDQMQNNLISQAAQMDTGSTPNDMIPAMNQVGCILFVPFIHHIIYPLFHRRHIYIKPIMRITIGFSFIALAMAYAAIVQQTIYSADSCHKLLQMCTAAVEHEPNRVNVWLQAPVFFLIAMGEAWSYATALEIAYSHAPSNLKAVIQAIFPLMAAIGSLCALALTPLAHDPNLVIFYACLAGTMALTTVIFWIQFRRYDQDQEVRKDGAGESVPLSRAYKHQSQP